MYTRVGRKRSRRISDSKLTDRDLRKRRYCDEDAEDIEEDDEDADLGERKLTNEEIEGLIELLPYKEALIKIAKGEFEIEKVEEETEEDTEDTAEDTDDNFEEDTDFAEDTEDTAEDTDDEDFDLEEEEDETEAVEDAKYNEIWAKRLGGNKK